MRALTIFVLKLGQIHFLLNVSATGMLGMPSTSQYDHEFCTSSPVITDPFHVNFNDSIVQHNTLGGRAT